MSRMKPIYSDQMLISRKKIVRDFLYRTYGRQSKLNSEDEDCWFSAQRCFSVSLK